MLSPCCRCTGNGYRGFRIGVKTAPPEEEGFLDFTDVQLVNEGLAGGLGGNGNAGAFCTSTYAVGLSVDNNNDQETSNFWCVLWSTRLMLANNTTSCCEVAVRCTFRARHEKWASTIIGDRFSIALHLHLHL
jgi:hypothetical protein